MVSFLHDIYTPVERTLIDAGSQETVKETRQAFQMAMRDLFSEAVEEIMGRKVVGFMSQVHLRPGHGGRDLRARAGGAATPD